MLEGQYSRRASMDVRDACALALRRVLEGIDRVIDGERIIFAHVFDEWPTFDDKYDSPAACVLPPPAWDYSDSDMVPHLLEDTVEPNPIPMPDEGQTESPAYGLYKTAEMLDRFELIIRCGSTAKRSMLKLAVEDAFQTRKVMMDPAGQRYGLLLDLPEYWSLTARASLISGANTDSEDAAARNLREATFVVSMQAPKVQLGEVWPMAMTITKRMLSQDGATIRTEVFNCPPPPF